MSSLVAVHFVTKHVELYKCLKCGCLVLAEAQSTWQHDKFHEMLDSHDLHVLNSRDNIIGVIE